MQKPSKKRILVVEDEQHIAEGLKLNLTLKGYDVQVAGSGVDALQQWKSWRPHLIVLDIMLPGIDGFSVLQHIRLEDDHLPVLILSAKADTSDKVKGFSCGVDDYLTKPFSLEEFLLRVDRLLARASYTAGLSAAAHGERFQIPRGYIFGSNRIDFETATAQCQAGKISLTEQEIKLLRLFIANKGKPLSRKQILEIGWGYDGATTTRTVDNFIVRFRKYFEEKPRKPLYFKSVRSVGYLFDHE